MSSSSGIDPLETSESSRLAYTNMPEVSKKKYEAAYKSFMDWRTDKRATSFSEDVLTAYFGEIGGKFKPSTLWSQYSMVKTMLSINNNVDIERYGKLRAFLKRKSQGYQPKEAATLTVEEIKKFIAEAPDKEHLLTKVALVMGILGACRRQELYNMKLDDITNLGSAITVTVPDSKSKVTRKFTVTGKFYELYKKYAELRPKNTEGPFFLNYQKGRCTIQRVGINKFGAMGKQIATYLQLPNPGRYTGHCFRRSSVTIMVDAAGEITPLKRHGERKSTAVAESYIDESD